MNRIRRRRHSSPIVALFLAASVFVALPAPSVDAIGVLPHPITRISFYEDPNAALSGDLTRIAFVTREQLAPNDLFSGEDLYLLDTVSGTITLISVGANDRAANSPTIGEPVISADGTRIAFTSGSKDLVPGVDPDHFDHIDVFLHDTVTGTTIRVNEHPQGTNATGDSRRPAISADGTKIAYSSIRTNLVAGDTNGTYDIFVYNTVTETTSRVSLTDAGLESNGYSREVSLNADGTRVAFTSHATNLVPGDANGSMPDVYVRDTTAGTTVRVSVGPSGSAPNGPSEAPSISDDGTRVAFASFATNLVAGDTNGAWDAFVHDTITAATSRVSLAPDETEFSQDVDRPFIDATGSRVAFTTPHEGQFAVFVRDLATTTTVKASIGDQRQNANAGSFALGLSGDGTEVAFGSTASTLVPGDTPRSWDIFITSAACCGDRDGDGLDNDEEVFLGTDPLVVDTDADGLTDGEEWRLTTDPLDTDTDNDTLIDGDEWFIHYTNPLLIDSDGDGVSDPDEVAAGTNPSGPPTAVGLVVRKGADWRLRYEDGSIARFAYGTPEDLPFMGDWDCDGIDTVGVFRPSSGFAFLRNSNDFGFADIDFLLGAEGDLPLVGDWDGDGCDSMGVYRAGRVTLTNTLADGPADIEFFFGIPGDVPFTGDFDGDGATEIGVYRDGHAYLRFDHTSGPADHDFYFGIPGDVPVAGDWDNDGADTIGVWRGTEASFYLADTNETAVAADLISLNSSGVPITGDFLRPPGA